MKRTIYLLMLCFIVSSMTMAQKTAKVEIQDLNTRTFKQKVWNFDKNKTFVREGQMPIILDFHATWCPPCKRLFPYLQEVQNKYKNKLIVYRIDVDQEPELAQRFNIEAMPTIIFIGSKNKFIKELGPQPGNLESLVKSYIFASK